MVRRIRSDATVGGFEKKNGLKPGTFRNEDGRDTRSDKTFETLRNEKLRMGKMQKYFKQMEGKMPVF